MRYRRFENPDALAPAEKVQLLAKYFSHYSGLAETNMEALNVNLPREAFAPVLDQIGGLLLDASRSAASQAGPETGL